MNHYCWNCFEDYAIDDYIKKIGTRGTCSYCGSRSRKVLSAEKLGHFVREGFGRAYEHIDDSGMHWDSENHEYTSETTAAEYLYEEVLAVDNDIVDDLIESSGPSQWAVMDGDYDPLDGGTALFVLKDEYFGDEYNSLSSAWNFFKFHVTHRWRFFDARTETSRASILQPIADHILRLEEIVPINSEFYRARVKRTDLPTEPPSIQEYIGPPPNRSSAHNRMSPAGIPYFYVSSDPETCITEIRPNVGEEVVVGKFISTKELKVLDLTSVPRISIKSIFDPSYDHGLRWAKDFAKGFIKELSRPYTIHDTVIDYIPTQVLSEFIRSSGYDGLKFSSSQKPDGVNYTFFCGPRQIDSYYDSYPGIKEFTDWFYLNEVTVKKVESLVLRHSHLENSTFTQTQVTPPTPPSPF